ncbi:XRE family transcriptional regulator [Pseudonocardiaceae bacterium YIM PH 21723]|nr:XRE family transcriptional regulator [Pseudonocardiaceae bacterium YIM PH 21723]
MCRVTSSNTRELGAFLRARREALSPAPMPRRGTRRTPGLRREEVAELAGVSVDYVIRLEQGRGLRPSPEVLDALAGALRLNEDERLYLFDLAQHRATGQRFLGGVREQLVHDLSPLPAMLINHRFDVLAWNEQMAALLCDFAAVPQAQRNVFWLCFFHPVVSNLYLDREYVLRESIADLRAVWAAHPEDHSLTELVEKLRANSAEFARLWELREVKVVRQASKRIGHPECGPLTVEVDVLTALGDSDHRLIIYRAADPVSQRVLDAITR